MIRLLRFAAMLTGLCLVLLSVGAYAEEKIFLKAFGEEAGQNLAERACKITGKPVPMPTEVINGGTQDRIDWRARTKQLSNIEFVIPPKDFIDDFADQACFASIMKNRKMTADEVKKLPDAEYQKCVDFAKETFRKEIKVRAKSPATCPGLAAYLGFYGAFGKARQTAKKLKDEYFLEADADKLAKKWCSSPGLMNKSPNLRLYFSSSELAALYRSPDFIKSCQTEFRYVFDERMRGYDVAVVATPPAKEKGEKKPTSGKAGTKKL